MRRRSLHDDDEILEVIDKCEACHMAMVDENQHPYLVPMNFGRVGKEIYLHSSAQGKKIDILRHNPQICLEFSTDYFLRYQSEQVACSWSMKYRSVLMFGQVEFIEGSEEKMKAMNHIMLKYAGREFPYNMPSIHEVCVFKLVPEEITTRAYGY